MEYWNDLSYKASVVIDNLGEGVDTYISPLQLGNGYASDMCNIDSRKYPILRTRESRDYSIPPVPMSSGEEIMHMGKHLNSKLFVIKTHFPSRATRLMVQSGSSWTDLGIVSNSWLPFASTNFLGNTIMSNIVANRQYNGVSVSNISPATHMPDQQNLLTVHANRLYTASFFDSRLYFSQLSNMANWNAPGDAGYVDIETSDGQYATGLYTFGNSVMYFKNDSIHEFSGTDPFNFELSMCSNRVGCVAGKTIREIRGKLYFLARDGVYSYAKESSPKLISLPISRYIDSITTANASCAGTDGERYYLYTPSQLSPNRLLIYDTRVDRWYFEDCREYSEFVEYNGELYGAVKSGEIIKMVAPQENENIGWYWESKAFNFNQPSIKQHWRRIFVTYELAAGATLSCYVSNSVKGNDFVKISSLPVNNMAVSISQIEIPFTIAQDAPFVRIRFDGIGKCRIHAIEFEFRARRKSYTGK